MSNVSRPEAESRRLAISSEQNAQRFWFQISRLKPPPHKLRELWGDLLTLASIAACAWLLYRIVF
jgi:hypothetical protein